MEIILEFPWLFFRHRNAFMSHANRHIGICCCSTGSRQSSSYIHIRYAVYAYRPLCLSCAVHSTPSNYLDSQVTGFARIERNSQRIDTIHEHLAGSLNLFCDSLCYFGHFPGSLPPLDLQLGKEHPCIILSAAPCLLSDSAAWTMQIFFTEP